MVDFIREMLHGFGAEATVLIMSMIPVVELRGAIPMGLPWGCLLFTDDLELHRLHGSRTLHTIWHPSSFDYLRQTLLEDWLNA